MIKSLNVSALFLFLLLLLSSNLKAQTDADRAYIIERTNVEALNLLAEKHTRRYEAGLEKAMLRGVPSEIVNIKNEKGYLSGFDLAGNPVYDFDDNVDAARSSRIDKIWVGGSTGLNLTGINIEIGHWEASGTPRFTHQELIGKITPGDFEVNSSHATHTAGTMIATGLTLAARGMAPSATILAYRSNDDEAEIADFGAAGGLVSCHSYGTGNPDGDIPFYGKYTENAREWDEILYNAPYLTLCKSAGNTRNDGVNIGDNGYDILFTTGGSKNVLTVGAVEDVVNYSGPSSVEQSSFSSWGPTDDWRVKPDLVANGVGLYSSDSGSNFDYSNKSGTSMSTPTVAGAVALLQEHYHNFIGEYMKAATVKGLLCGTTDEAGPAEGPDFQNGWGLMNAERAANVISNNWETSSMNELNLENGQSYTTTIETDGTVPFGLTIAWTDPVGSIPSGGTDVQTPILVNDLDVKLYAAGVEYGPWVLTPNGNSDNFATPAVRGDNFRDNIERIDVANLPAGFYTVKVTHKDNLVNGNQDFSLMMRGIISNTLGLGELESKEQAFAVYPNPTSTGMLNVSILKESISGNYDLQIFDMLGKLRKQEVHAGAKTQLNISDLSAGMYIVNIRINNVNYKRTIVVSQ